MKDIGSATKSHRFSTLEIVIMVVIATIFGLVGLGLNSLFFLLSSIMGPAWSSAILAGPFFSCGLMAARIIRKPGVAFSTQVLNSVAAILFGDPFGVTNLAFGFVQGVAFETGFAIFRYRKWNWSVILLAAFLATIFDIGPMYLFGGFASMPLWSWLGPIMLRPLFVLPIVYVLAIGVPDILQKAGIITQGKTD